ncbi:hypothetical protein LCGC14_2785610 [marine sediment metagenome]|uniref:Uncharacterized protein n=1 Tax=marine sediment metagenome TaxID=412755 RepID=A0A0F8YS06_9ZZZZ
MVNDKPTAIVNESIRRMMDECMDSIKVSDEAKFSSFRGYVRPGEIKRLIALNNVMMRILQSVPSN